MTDSDISIKSVLVKYIENGRPFYIHKTQMGEIIGMPKREGALLFTPGQAESFINHALKTGNALQFMVEPVK